jgi:two-component system sensor histidine kinase KdpD
MNDHRPDPDQLLARLKEEETQRTRGKLMVFLGAAPGVGKTYAMLEAAHERRHEGVDVAVGVVETHGRPETQALLRDLPALPLRSIEYQGVQLTEMDLDAILARRPQLVLVDELAHTNAPGSRHPKRYLDVQELLDAGIDVYSTVNIQHLESLNDTVAQITGIRVRETVPDGLLERADEIEVIDLSPEALLQRLAEGKVYVPDQAERAIHNYFRKGNLTALRELALRRTADRVDVQMQSYMHAHDITGPWPAGWRIMVCVGPSPLSTQLVRTARRIAERRHAEWLAVYVETPQHYRLSHAGRDRLVQTLRLAEQLGGEAVTIPGENVAEDLIRYAVSRNVTELVIGKSLRPRWMELLRGSLVAEVIGKSGNINVYVITNTDARTAGPPPRQRWSVSVASLGGYPLSITTVGLAAVLATLLRTFLALPNLSLVFLTAVLFSAVSWGLGPSILAAILSMMAYDFFFVDPVHTFTISDPQDILALIVFLMAAGLTSHLAARARDQAAAARRREAKTAALYVLSHKIAGAAGLDNVLRAIVDQVAHIVNARVVALLPEDGRLVLRQAHPPETRLTEAEMAAATWAWQHDQPTGRGTDTLPGNEWFYLPLHTAQGTLGILGLRLEPPGTGLAPDQRRLVEALAVQAAVGIERTRLVQDMESARVLAETERLRTALLSSISHDLRTPLASITGAVTSLLARDANFDELARRELLLTIQEEAEQLDRFVGNLLDMTRLESGALTLNREWVEIGDVIGAALNRMEQRLSQHQLVVSVPTGLPMLRLDFVLVEQVLVNLLDNAAKYSPPGKSIRVSALRAGQAVVVEVEDEGIGVPPTDLERIFDKFYRVQRGDRQTAGTGLGLSICRGIVEAHGGTIVASIPGTGRGTIFRLTLPLDSQPSPTVVDPDRMAAVG